MTRLTQMERLLSAMGKGSKMPSDGLGLYLGDGLPRPGLGELRTNELLELVREARRNNANALAAETLMRVAQEPPINGNELAQVRVVLAAQQLRSQTTWTSASEDWRENPEYVGFIDHS